MKAEINKENKAKFFALYWGQKLLTDDKLSEIEVCNLIEFEWHQWKLSLKPLSSIIDEDAEIIDLGSEDYNENGWWDKHGDFYWWASSDVDYLRLKGYALPWMGLSVEEMVQAGWIKLIES